MPDRYYLARNEPPSTVDHILAHPGTVSMVAWWALIGMLLVVDGLSKWSIFGSSNVNNPLLLSGIGVAIGAGGASALWGAITRTNRLDLTWDAQKIGHVLAGAGWTAFAIVAFVTNFENLYLWLGGIANVILAVLTIISVSRTESHKRQEMRDNGWNA